MKPTGNINIDRAFKVLDSFQIEIPSWGFANTGTRFGKFVQAAAASTIEEKFADAAEVNRLTGVTPTLALHVLWDLPKGVADVPVVKELERRFGIQLGLHQSKSVSGPGIQVRFALQSFGGRFADRRLAHMLDSIEIGKALGSRDISLWMADGSNYPGTQSIRKRIGWLEEALRIVARSPGAESAAAGGVQAV